jgi:RNA polymerase sigma-70 factor (ECF subfamily)
VNSDNPSPAELAALVEKPEDFAKLVQRWEKPLLSFLRRFVKLEEAEELAQETFLRVWQNLLGFDGREGSFSGWLFRIARNGAISAHRKKKVRGEEIFLSEEEEKRLFSLLADDEDLGAAAIQKDLSRRLRAALEKIPEKFRTPLILFFLEGKGYAEIAEILRRPEGTVATLLSRGKKALRREAEKLSLDSFFLEK